MSVSQLIDCNPQPCGVICSVEWSSPKCDSIPFQIQAYIQCGRLKAAYLIAVKRKLADEVRNISRVASQAGQVTIRDICDKWLQQNTSGSDTERPERSRTSGTDPSKRN